jgi:DNA-binding transcriptional regulator YdaS (Cro superfamily)
MLVAEDPKVDLSEPNGIHDAVARAGTQAMLAASLGVTQQAVSNWLRQGWAPARRAHQIEKLYGVRALSIAHPRFAALAR